MQASPVCVLLSLGKDEPHSRIVCMYPGIRLDARRLAYYKLTDDGWGNLRLGSAVPQRSRACYMPVHNHAGLGWLLLLLQDSLSPAK